MKLNIWAKKALIKKCKYPYYFKEKTLLIHPDDGDKFWNDLRFISIGCYPSKEKKEKEEIGKIFGYSILLQDDLQILLLAMKGTKSVED